MISLNEYLADPCGTLSIPYWKAASITIPENLSIYHQSQLPADLSGFHSVECYFRLYHNLKSVHNLSPAPFSITTAGTDDIETIVSIINCSYHDIQVTSAQISGYRRTPVFAPELWVLAWNEHGGCIGCGIADLDPDSGELILEWIQVLPEFRRQGIGRAIVNQLLFRGRTAAQFATVSGRQDDPSCPEALYRSCGFTGSDLWYICRK